MLKTFEQVTIMFVNTADFSMIVNNTEPAEIIKFINSTISIYDNVVQGFDKVQKVRFISRTTCQVSLLL